MRSNKQSLLFFINSLRETDQYIQDIYLGGGCYQFHLLLAKLFKGCKPYINMDENHIATMYKGELFDINGIVTQDKFRPLRDDEINGVSLWSFHKHNLLQLTECEFCGEPYVYKYELNS